MIEATSRFWLAFRLRSTWPELQSYMRYACADSLGILGSDGCYSSSFDATLIKLGDDCDGPSVGDCYIFYLFLFSDLGPSPVRVACPSVVLAAATFLRATP